MSVSRRHFFFGSLAVPASLVMPLSAAKKVAALRPNLLLILVDNLPAWLLGSSGNQEVRTPNLDRLAQGGTRFLKHFACTTAPAPSRAAVLTGRTPMQLGDSETPADAGQSLEKILTGLGYTAHAADSSDAAGFLDQQQPAGKPFFLALGCRGLRPPYEGAARKYRDLYAQTKFDTFNAERAPAANAQVGKEMFTDLAGSLRSVAAAVTALDDDVAAMVATLSRRRLLDHTLIVFTSTSGALLGRHGLWGASEASMPPNMYEESVSTPLIWSWPGHVPAQAVRPELVSTYDFLPALCDLLGAEPPGNLCGRSYLALATGKPLPKKQPWRKNVFSHFRNTDMARVDRYKLVLRDQGKGPGELYDEIADPVEKVNQYENPQFMTIRASMADQLAAWKQKFS